MRAARGQVLVSLQRQSKGSWATVDTDDTPADTAQHGSGDVWTETFQFDRCKPLGTYRFHVTGNGITLITPTMLGQIQRHLH